MTIRELYDNVELFTEDQRIKYLIRLQEKLNPLSRGELMNFQNKWDAEKGMDVFFSEQAKIFKTCIALELGPIGIITRQLSGLEPLNWNDEV